MGGSARMQRRSGIPGPPAALLLVVVVMTLASCVSVPENPPEGVLEQFPEQQPFAESRFTTIGGVRMPEGYLIPEGIC